MTAATNEPSHPLLETLRTVNLFSTLDEDTLRLLQTSMQRMTYQPGEILCKEGDAADRMYVIESGEISVLKTGPEGQPAELTVLPAGDIAGELSLFGQSRRSATLQARTETAVWVMEHNAFQELLDQHAALSKALFTSISRHLRRQNSVLARVLTQDDRSAGIKVAFFDTKPYMADIFRERNCHNCAFTFYDSRLTLDTVSLAAGFRVVCVFVNDKLDQAVIEELHAIGVELIALRCAGYNNVDLEACKRLGVSVVRVPAYSPYAVAEHAVALMMTLNRKTHRAHNRVRESNFSLSGLVGFDVHQKTVGVIGIGRIGRCVLNIMAGFGCTLLAHSRTPKSDLVEQLGVRFVDLDELLAQADIISLHTPLTPETYHLIDAGAIAKMKPGVMLINTGRGPLIDTEALLDGLKSGHIGYAGLDVYEEESGYFFEDFSDRVMTDDVLARLTTFNNVLVTSHQAFLTREALQNIADTTLENIREYELGARLGELPNSLVG